MKSREQFYQDAFDQVETIDMQKIFKVYESMCIQCD